MRAAHATWQFGRAWPPASLTSALGLMSTSPKLASVLLCGLALAGCSQRSEDSSRSEVSSISRAVVDDGGDTNHPAWIERLALLKPGATRAQVEALLPQGYDTAPAFGSSGMHREFYSVSNAWLIAVVYRSPDMRYHADPKQALIDGPIITRLDSNTRQTYRDPRGSFILKKVSNETNR